MWRETKTRTKCVFVPVIRTMANAHETETREEDTIPEAEHMELWKNSNNFFSLPAPAVDSSQLKYFSLDLNVCATVYPHMYYTYTDRLLSLFKWLFSTCETMCCSAAGFRSAGNLP